MIEFSFAVSSIIIEAAIKHPVLARLEFDVRIYTAKGYLPQKLVARLRQQVEFITKMSKNMKPLTHTAFDQALLRHRSSLELITFRQYSQLIGKRTVSLVFRIKPVCSASRAGRYAQASLCS